MIIDYVKNLYRYKGISENLDIAIDWLLSDKSASLADKEAVKENNVIVMKQNITLKSMDEQKWENHLEHIDIHVAVEGGETIGYLNSADTINWTEHKPEKDCDKSEDKTEAYTARLLPGMCAIVWPNEPHKPNTGVGDYVKLVVKVKM